MPFSNQTKIFQESKIIAYFMQRIEDIYFFEVITKYISSNVLKYQHFHECVARVKVMIFSIHEMKYFLDLPEKSKFSFYFILSGQ